MSIKFVLPLLLLSSWSAIAADNPLALQMQQLNQVTLANEANLWQRMRDGFALDHRETKEVKYWEKRYGNPKYFNIIMQNAAPYLYFVVAEMERRGIPTELALIPIVESTYNPNAVSPAAISTGMWQFVGSSGRRFGLAQTSDLDERKDIVKSTRAAVNYLQYLHDLFGSWELAIAAYNWGEGNINNAVVKAGSKNFYDLDVRDVTRQYVPKVIALANIIQHPQRFGIKLTDLTNQPYFAIVKSSTPVTVSQFMTEASLSDSLNHKLNPQYASVSYLVSPAQRLLLPVSNQPQYLASTGTVITTPVTSVLATDGANSVAATPTNDGIDQLAVQGAAATAASAAVATNSQPVTAGVSKSQASAPLNNDQINDLLVTGGSDAPAVKPGLSRDSFISYTVVPGDTLYSIAKKFAVPIESIRKDNQLVDNTVKLNQKIKIRQMAVN